MSGNYSGSLSSYRKNELKEIANAMDVGIDTNTLRFDLEDAIRDGLRSHERLHKDKRFAGLWEAMSGSDEEGAVDEDDSDDNNEGSNNLRTKAVQAAKSLTRTPRKSLSNLASNLSTPAENALASVEKSAKALVPSKETPARFKKSATNTMTVYARKSSSNLREAAQQAKQGTTKVVVQTQEIASSAWTITSALIVLEISYLAWSAIPWEAKAFGPHKWLVRPPTSAFILRYPDLSVLVHPTFTNAFMKWAFFTILLPLIASIILAFPQHSSTKSSGRSSRRSQSQGEISAPNALSFNLARASIILINGYIFSRGVSKVHWSFEAVEGYPALALLASSLAAIFSFAELK